ncbi:MAG TPA: hypothetical protein IAC04_01225 [Candidatus Coprenecus stercoravium]|uniref:BACON domain-containing protein n=1 Tax=Candidatus Coprenecus stercoravium TaxID=2840735 RepID=A0A9D2K9E1_9BACT|nr:hypothetical protein [Candidatus Coprenecus stercoravium]
MKKAIYFKSALAAVAATLALTVMTGCEDDNQKTPGNQPEFTAATEGDIQANAKGGEYSIEYSLTNPVEGGRVSAAVETGCDWITDIDCESSDSKVTFTVEENKGNEAREAGITVTYSYGDDERVSFRVNVHQNTYADDLTDLTFTFDIKPKVHSAVVDIHPSDPAALYIVNAITDSYYQQGYTDEAIMQYFIDLYINAYGSAYSDYLFLGDFTGLEITGCEPHSSAYIIAFGVDPQSDRYNSVLAKEEFTTLSASETDASVTGEMSRFWAVEDLVAYNSEYEILEESSQDPQNGGSLYAALDFTFSGSAERAYFAIFIQTNDINFNNLTPEQETQLYNTTLSNGSMTYKEDPAQLFFMNPDENNLLCIVAEDSIGNYSAMYKHIINLKEENKSTDYATFDQVFNDFANWLTGYSVSSVSKIASPLANNSVVTPKIITLK